MTLANIPPPDEANCHIHHPDGQGRLMTPKRRWRTFHDWQVTLLKALASLNEQYGFVDEAMMKHIIQLRKRREQAAVTEAIELFAGVMTKRAEETNKATDNIGQAWNGVEENSI
jgi:hypothetical protein